MIVYLFFFFKQKTAYEMRISDWSSDVCSSDLLRAVHTMNGAFAMTEVPAITDALSPAETYIRRLLAAKQDASGEGVAAIGELDGVIRATVPGLHAAAPQVPTCAALAATLVAQRDSLPEWAPVTDSPHMPHPVEPHHTADPNDQ